MGVRSPRRSQGAQEQQKVLQAHPGGKPLGHGALLVPFSELQPQAVFGARPPKAHHKRACSHPWLGNGQRVQQWFNC